MVYSIHQSLLLPDHQVRSEPLPSTHTTVGVARSQSGIVARTVVQLRPTAQSDLKRIAALRDACCAISNRLYLLILPQVWRQLRVSMRRNLTCRTGQAVLRTRWKVDCRALS